MKIIPTSCLKAILVLSILVPLPSRAGLSVHEWGTFTVLQGSDGSPLRWYLPWEDQHALPDFVHHPIIRGKMLADGMALARMETPVLYFYPDREMNVRVITSLPSGGLSEWFPNALDISNMTQHSRTGQNPTSLLWVGQLSPPNSPLASRIPTTADEAGRHYNAARAVPEAWLFQERVPLSISPAPEKIARVYVARLEILTPGREGALNDLLTGGEPIEESAPRLKSLALGRFTQGALERAKVLQAQTLTTRLNLLQAAK